MVKKSFILISSLLAFCLQILQAQTPNEELKAAQKKYPNKDGVFTIHNKIVEIELTKAGTPAIRTFVENERLLFNNNAKYYSGASIYSGTFVESHIGDAYTQIPTEKKYKKQKVVDFSESEDIGNGIFFSDETKTSFQFPAMAEGVKTYYSYYETYNEPRFFGSFFFGSYLPVEKSELTVVTDKDIELEWKLYGVNTDQIVFEKTPFGKKTQYNWYYKNVPEIIHGDESPEFRYTRPHILVRIASYTNSLGEKVPYLNNPATLHKWYASFLDSIQENNTTNLVPLADSITNGISSEFEKVRAIYYWVQDNIKYIAFEDGYGGLVPRSANLVCDRKFGDCKDMSNTIVSLLEAANIKAYHTWIGSRSLPYTYEDFASPAVDNHMIATYYDSLRNPHFLDATGKFLPIDLTNSFIQGKQALVNISKDSFRLETLPITPASCNLYLDTFQMEINEGLDVIGNGTVHLQGYFRNNMAYALDALSSNAKNKYFNSLFERGSNKSNASVKNIENQENRDLPLLLTYSFKVEDYVKAYENELYFNPHVLKRFLELSVNKDENPYYIEFESTESQKYHITIPTPKGYSIKQIPSNTSVTNKTGSYSANYIASADGDVVTIDLELTRNEILIPASAYAEYESIINALKTSFSKVITYQKP